MDGHPGQVALVTGASRGVGKGVAIELADAGYRVYGTGRTILDSDLPPTVSRLPCDHTEDARVREVFEEVGDEAGRLDLLVGAQATGQHTLRNGEGGHGQDGRRYGARAFGNRGRGGVAVSGSGAYRSCGSSSSSIRI